MKSDLLFGVAIPIVASMLIYVFAFWAAKGWKKGMSDDN